tara:strand:- start:707 stop:1405 length:699 start_codon:yes stop_codon:yes gene_type:complete
MALRYLIIEDEPPAIALLEEYARKTDFLQSAGTFSDPQEALHFIKDRRSDFDFLFLDVKMPHINGQELLALADEPIPTIFVTAYDQYAVQSYDYNTIAYLTKPVAYPKFLAATYKMREYLQINAASKAEEQSFFVKDGSRYLRLEYSEILFLKGLSNYLQLITADKTYTLHLSLKKAGQSLPMQFVRVHQSYLVNLNRIDEIYGNTIYIGKEEIPVGRQFKDELLKRLNALM